MLPVISDLLTPYFGAGLKVELAGTVIKRTNISVERLEEDKERKEKEKV